jgi:hypothetical protein
MSAPSGRLPLDLLAGRHTELGANGVKLGRIPGHGPLGDEYAAHGKKRSQATPWWVRLLTIVEEY